VSFYTVRIICGKRHQTVECPSVCLSRRSTAAAAVGGFAAEVGHGQQIVPIDAAVARHAGHVNFGPTVRTSNKT